ncbi:G protein-activated inward rectifier potassium channel 3-like [Salmo trutta]|uniref:G protein-activated inward rectifier potassium channel 3 n=1 Tax=Salmo trutta TaxID=8032 RepID=A0A673YIN3_SALTR|nr:G protein-activated inward rectifier potassium channel 3-like [Salmo trutta]
MAFTMMCSRVTLHEPHNGDYRSPTRIDPRRNSIPPAQTLTAKHLPRPPPESTRFTPYPKRVAAKTNMALTMLHSTRVSLIPSSNNNNDNFPVLSPQPAPSAFPQPQPQSPGPHQVVAGLISQEVDTCQYIIPTEEPEEPATSHRGRHLKRFSSRWYSGAPFGGPFGSTRSSAHGTSGENKPHKLRCKLLGDERPSYGTANKQRQRYVTKDGKCRVNLGPIEDKSRFLLDIFTTLVDLKYRWFLFVFTMCYVVTWVAFAEIYFLDAWLRDDVAHVHDPQWQPCFENVDSFISALLLSVESQRTIGYGSRLVTANCMEGVVLLMAQSIIGSIIDALMVGCMFVKISRPQKRAQTLIFSKHCVISERDEKLCLLFRIGDLRASHMVDAKIRAKLIKSRQTKEGEFIPLEQSEINLGYDTGGDRLLLVEPQTITHVINESSPFWEIGAERLTRERFEIIIILEGIVEASGMICQARTSYTEDEILWGHRFESCMSLEKGSYRVDRGAFDKTFTVQTPTISAKEKSDEKEEVLF